jgi:hypothetical protein
MTGLAGKVWQKVLPWGARRGYCPGEDLSRTHRTEAPRPRSSTNWRYAAPRRSRVCGSHLFKTTSLAKGSVDNRQVAMIRGSAGKSS